MENSTNKLKCPKCNADINVNSIVKDEFNKKNQKEREEQIKNYKKAMAELKEKEEEIENKVQKGIKNKLKIEEEELRKSIRKDIKNEHKEEINLLQEELKNKSTQVQELNTKRAEIEKLKRENQEIKSKVEADSEKIFNQKLIEVKEKIIKKMEEDNELKDKDRNNKMEEQTKLINEMKRKAEQGSMQSQGEIQEIAIEEYLKDKYRFDTIEEIQKGVRGADCLQIVNTRENQNCGKIYYESKRTKDFNKHWIEKFKTDMREKNVDIGVLVTQALPKELNKMGLIDGVWVCTFEEFKNLSLVLREFIIKLQYARISQENKTEKIEYFYNYLSSPQFSMQIEAVEEAYKTMKKDLDTERRAMNRIWKQREKQLEKVIDNASSMYGEIKGIIGDKVISNKTFELPYSDAE